MELIGITFAIFTLTGFYLGFTIGNNIKKYFAREPDVEYVQKNLKILCDERANELALNLKANNRTMISSDEATKMIEELSNEIYDGLSDNMKNYINITFTEDEVLRFITSEMMKKLLIIMGNINKR